MLVSVAVSLALVPFAKRPLGRWSTEARLAVFEFPEGRYNPRRRYSALDYRSPLISSGPRSETIAQ
ncbi:MAG: hypothetical protein DME01_00050 [Candidatus Rokuibacteriota bacterium]|nr:MAG: hypothetical protein DME01_00050 [Candidatus Rokubacteria bacterium]